MGYVIAALCFAYMFWVYIANADLKIEKINEYLQKKKLSYVRHKKINKPYSSNFEIGEGLFTSLHFRKHHYEIDAMDIQGNQVVVSALFYQNVSFIYRNRVFFNIED